MPSSSRSHFNERPIGIVIGKVWKKFGQSSVCARSFRHSSSRYFCPVRLYSHSASSMFSPPRATAHARSGCVARLRYWYLKKRSISTSTRLSPVAEKYCLSALRAIISGQWSSFFSGPNQPSSRWL